MSICGSPIVFDPIANLIPRLLPMQPGYEATYCYMLDVSEGGTHICCVNASDATDVWQYSVWNAIRRMSWDRFMCVV